MPLYKFTKCINVIWRSIQLLHLNEDCKAAEKWMVEHPTAPFHPCFYQQHLGAPQVSVIVQ
eukprot:6412382-Ditylum_brightwellii.AAC.1